MNGDRSIKVGGSVSGSALTTGDHNVTKLTVTTLPPAAAVDFAAVLAELRSVMTAASTAAQRRIDLELSEAAAEAAKPEPRKPKIAGALERAVDAFKETAEFADKAGKIAELVKKAAGWIGAAHLGGLLTSVGLTI